MRSIVLVLGFVVVGCGQPKLQRVEGELAVAPGALAVRTFVGFPVERSVRLTSTGRATLEVTARVGSGLVLLGPGTFEVEAGQAVEVRVRVEAKSAGLVNDMLELTVDGAKSVVAVSGEILATPACEAAAACRQVRFDPITERCEISALADGSACAGTCLEGASCQAGVCVGTARSCDDGNACTSDACGADGECTHADSSARCASKPGACTAPACDPRLGCVVENVADGTACGPNDCTTALVCLAGVCAPVTAPEGSTCSEGTPCRTAGRCQANACVWQTHPIAAAWELKNSTTVKRTLLGVVSPSGLIFAVERHEDPGNCLVDCSGIVIVAYDGNGFERWRTGMYSEFWSTTALYDVDRSQLIVISKTWARALNGATGAQKWFTELSSEIPVGNPTPAGARQVYPIKLALLPAAKRAVAAFSEGYDTHVAWVFGLDLVTGAQAFKVRRDGHLYGMMTTAADELFMGTAGCWAPASWNGTFDATGAMKWNVFQPGIPSLTTGSQLYFQPYGSPSNFVGRIDILTGALSQEAPDDNKALLANGSKLFLTSTLAATGLTAWDAAQHKARWTITGMPLMQAFLTEGDGVLGLSDTRAAHVNDSGKLDWSCELKLSSTWSTSLVNGKVIAQTADGLGAFPVGALKVSAKGWSVSDRGNPERTSRAR